VSQDIIDLSHLSTSSEGFYRDFGPGGIAAAQLRLARTKFLSKAELAFVLENNPGRALPQDLQSYLIRTLRGEAKAKRGRRPLNPNLIIVAASFYHQALATMQRWDKRKAERARKQRWVLPKAELSAHERALAFAAKRIKLKGKKAVMTPETLRNRLSEMGLL
jgi:hypothetical protein